MAPLAALLLISGCSGPAGQPTASPPAASSTAPASSPAAGAGETMTLSGYAFSALTVKPGATVTVKNTDGVAHTVHVQGTAVDVTVDPGGQATFTAPDKTGAYPLTCDFHAGMHGTLTVAG